MFKRYGPVGAIPAGFLNAIIKWRGDMHTENSIRSVGDILTDKIPLPHEAGVYAFWWIADRAELLAADRQIVLKGPGGNDVSVHYEEWWPEELKFPCLYVGKTTNIRKRFSQHIMRDTKPDGRLHMAHSNFFKVLPYNSSCQLRFGIEHIFPKEEGVLKTIKRAVGFSYTTDFPNNAIAERFFMEDRLVGTWRPWFNIDSER
jgi:hypothetical protein